MKQRKIFITEPQGLIGKILIENLSGHFDIYGLDMKDAEGRKHFKADISNYDELDSVFKELGSVDCIVHLAGDSRMEAEWESVLKNNIIGTRNIYECAKTYGIRKVIFASSNHVTGGGMKIHISLL